MKTLFVSGCQRSGTTAFADYLNLHPEMLILRERYHFVPEKLSPDFFDFDRILDWTEDDKDERRKIGSSYKQYHADLLASKTPVNLKWIGDKAPFYMDHLETLLTNNPGAHFIILYRPIEEVAESWEARAKDPRQPNWASERGFEIGVQRWNFCMKKTREFIESEQSPQVLILGYQDFFHRNETCIPLLCRFLGLDLDETVRRSWKEMSQKFEQQRRAKQPLTIEQRRFVEENKERVAEEWILDRIKRQWTEPEIYAGGQRAAPADSTSVSEVRWLREEIGELEGELEDERQKARQVKRKLQHLERQMQEIRGSRTWKLVWKLGKLKSWIIRSRS